MQKNDDKKSEAIKMLKDKSRELNRLPKRTDFDNDSVCFIKQKLGPWPRALEQSGLKEITKISAKEKSKTKRERLREKKEKRGNKS